MLAIAALASADLRGDRGREPEAISSGAPILSLNGLWIQCYAVSDCAVNSAVDYKACAAADPNAEWNLFSLSPSGNGAIIGQAIGKASDGSFAAARQELGFSTGSDSFYLRRSGSDVGSGEFTSRLVDLIGDGSFDRIIGTPTFGTTPFCLVRVKLGDLGGIPTSTGSPQ